MIAADKITEINHSEEAVPEQCRHLLDEKKIKATEHNFGKITKRCVLYRGKIKYLNVEKYLKSL